MREASGTASVSGCVPLPTCGAGQSDAGDVARRHHQREAERDLAVAVGQGADQREADNGALSRRQVADAHGEDAGAFFLGDGGAMAGLDGLGVLLARLVAFLQFALDDPPGHLELKRGHGGPVGQGEDVRCLQRLVVGVDEGLAHFHAGDQAVEASLDLQRGQRQTALCCGESAEAGIRGGLAGVSAQGAEVGVGESGQGVEHDRASWMEDEGVRKAILTARMATSYYTPTMRKNFGFSLGVGVLLAAVLVPVRRHGAAPTTPDGRRSRRRRRAAEGAEKKPATGKVLVLDNERTLTGDIELRGRSVPDQASARRDLGSRRQGAEAVRLAGGSLRLPAVAGQPADPDERLRLTDWCRQHGLLEQALAEAQAAAALAEAQAADARGRTIRGRSGWWGICWKRKRERPLPRRRPRRRARCRAWM